MTSRSTTARAGSGPAATELTLRPREFDLLALLAAEAGRVVTRERIMDEVWDENWYGSTKTLDVHISALRRKLVDERGSGLPVDHRAAPRGLPARRAVKRRIIVSIVGVAVIALLVLGIPLAVAVARL